MKSDFTVPAGTLDRLLGNQAGLNEYLGLEEHELRAIASLGVRLYEQGRASEARTVFQGLIALDPNLYFGNAALGAMDLIDGQLDSALGHLTKALELNPDDPSVHANLGEVLLRQARSTEAQEHFQCALALDPLNQDPGADRARAIMAGLNLSPP
ncbi:MAG TPA: tetratricopeptide repeat protein [Candidatus Solibacter sp.]|nr:tetratricopeptide repeat protein [Candidatus Solibacter sp.]